ncbi:MAG: DUF3160 domain-containing protein [Cyclobacteriaceae bacterium]
MKSILSLSLLIAFQLCYAQSEFSLSTYQSIISSNVTADQLKSISSPSGPYCNEILDGPILDEITFLSEISRHFSLTADELNLLRKNHFVITERLQNYSPSQGLLDIYKNDLPIFFTSDLLLHGLHKSYDAILIQLERNVLAPKLKDLIKGLHDELENYKAQHRNNQLVMEALKDVELYLLITLSLLEEPVSPVFQDNIPTMDSIRKAISEKQLLQVPLFTKAPRTLDFSQFTIRGHYEQEEDLQPYFLASMWLGRIDFWMSKPPEPTGSMFSDLDIQQMSIAGLILNELITVSDGWDELTAINKVIQLLVGNSDNLTPFELQSMLTSHDISAEELTDSTTYELFKSEIQNADQQLILSNFFFVHGTNEDEVSWPVSYRLLGQRYILDSHILSSIVHPYSRLLMPDPLNVLYALGNQDAVFLLEDDLETYKYGARLEAMKYLISTYDDEYWSQSFYSSWLNAIRSVASQPEGNGAPFFTKTGAWRHQKMNTQLASWTQLRHDNLLYAKQSYTGGITCTYPYGYIEPIPSLYDQVSHLANRAQSILNELRGNEPFWDHILDYYERMEEITLTLATIARKELDYVPLSESEINFIRQTLYEQMIGCGPEVDGWLSELFYQKSGFIEGDIIVADIHTQPTDENGNIVGKVLHTGTGLFDLGVFIAPSPCADSTLTAYTGITLSYYQQETDNFERLTDSKWETEINNQTISRPEWVYTYMADKIGTTRSTSSNLPSQPAEYNSVEKQLTVLIPGRVLGTTYAQPDIYPNPSIDQVNFRIELDLENVNVQLIDLQGRHIVDRQSPIVNGTTSLDVAFLKRGIYVIRLTGPGLNYQSKLILK